MKDGLPTAEESRWLLLRSFYSSWRRFLVLFDDYERRVKEFTQRFDTDRSHLRLEPDDLASLLDFKALEALRDREVSLLREVSHLLFRTRDATDRFDHLVSVIYHEISALKEEHYTLREEFVREESIEYDRFYREVNRYYPKRLRHIRNLYRKADRRLRGLLPTMNRDKVLVRSLYLFGGDLLRGIYPGGVGELYAALYPEGGAVEAYSVAAASFSASGFTDQAIEAYGLCVEAAADPATVPPRRGAGERGAAMAESARERITELRASLSGVAGGGG